jgi:hypothetical protein
MNLIAESHHRQIGMSVDLCAGLSITDIDKNRPLVGRISGIRRQIRGDVAPPIATLRIQPKLFGGFKAGEQMVSDLRERADRIAIFLEVSGNAPVFLRDSRYDVLIAILTRRYVICIEERPFAHHGISVAAKIIEVAGIFILCVLMG